MSKLLQGMSISFTDGTTGKILQELGSGGQGTVYLIERQGKKYALKWYHKSPSSRFSDNMKENIRIGSPSPEFLWPLADTEMCYDSYGYLMDLRPQGFHDFTKFILGGVDGVSCNDEITQINAAINICSAFQKLHLKGLSYQDLNDGNFFINPQTGEVLIADNDNAAPDKTNISGIKGKCRYMAPEVVLGSDPDKYSDYFSLAVVLFKFFFLDHPLEGKYNQKCPCLTEKFERILYGEKPVFIFDELDKSNEATDVNINAIQRWPISSMPLRQTFLKAFSNESMHNPTKRVSEREWIKSLISYRSSYCTCPVCGQDTYIEKEDHGICKECNQARDIYWIAIVRDVTPLVEGQKLYLSHIANSLDHQTISALVVKGSKDPSKIFLCNKSNFDWNFSYKDPQTGKLFIKVIKPNEGAPILDGCKISFGNYSQGIIKLIKHK